jgi:hypothetical protein
MNTFVEMINGTIQSEYLDRFYEKANIGRINEILYDCLTEYNFYRSHESLNLFTPIEYCSKLINNKDPACCRCIGRKHKLDLGDSYCYHISSHRCSLTSFFIKGYSGSVFLGKSTPFLC